LAALTARVEEATAAIAQKQAALARLDMDAVAAESAARVALEERAGALKAVHELEEDRRKAESLTKELAGMAERRVACEKSLVESAAELEALQQKIAAARAEAASVDELRAESAALQARAEELDRTIHRLEERRQTFADAPDANWGTVHAMSKQLIKQIDLVDDLISHLAGQKGSKEAIEQLKIFRAGLMDILTEFSVVPYRFEAGFTVDISARKKIQIVESKEDNGQGTRIQKTYRPGYVCSNGPVGVQTLLRKAEVSILLGR
jgi:chromosome segregation ATPase